MADVRARRVRRRVFRDLRRSRRSADWCLDWLERVEALASEHGHFADDSQFKDLVAVLDEAGLLVDLEQCKRVLRALCDRLDSRTLLPAASDRLLCTRRAETVEARLGDRCYVFPAADTLLTAITLSSS